MQLLPEGRSNRVHACGNGQLERLCSIDFGVGTAAEAGQHRTRVGGGLLCLAVWQACVAWGNSRMGVLLIP
jgi:hypothetical protein